MMTHDEARAFLLSLAETELSRRKIAHAIDALTSPEPHPADHLLAAGQRVVRTEKVCQRDLERGDVALFLTGWERVYGPLHPLDQPIERVSVVTDQPKENTAP